MNTSNRHKRPKKGRSLSEKRLRARPEVWCREGNNGVRVVLGIQPACAACMSLWETSRGRCENKLHKYIALSSQCCYIAALYKGFSTLDGVASEIARKGAHLQQPDIFTIHEFLYRYIYIHIYLYSIRLFVF